MVNTISKILGIARRTYFHWQKDEDKCYAINLFNKYFTKEELEEFIAIGKIEKFDKLNFLYNEVIEKNKKVYIETFTNNFQYRKLSQAHDIFIDFYFSFLIELSEKNDLINSNFNNLLSLYLNNYLMEKFVNTINDEELMKLAINHQFKEFKKEFIEWENVKILAYAKEEIEKTLKMFNNEDFSNIQKHLENIKNWDTYMLIYLDEIIKSNLDVFIDSGNEELLYHAIGFNVYLHLKKEKPRIKLNLISMINEKLIKEDISILKIEEMIKNGKYLEHVKSIIKTDDLHEKYILNF